jgi:hypothetical protein
MYGCIGGEISHISRKYIKFEYSGSSDSTVKEVWTEKTEVRFSEGARQCFPWLPGAGSFWGPPRLPVLEIVPRGRLEGASYYHSSHSLVSRRRKRGAILHSRLHLHGVPCTNLRFPSSIRRLTLLLSPKE